MSARKEFPLFPFKYWRPTLSFLEIPVSSAPINSVDPWAKREAWRFHPFFSAKNRIYNAAPGLGLAIAAFGVFLGYEFWNNNYGPGKEEKEKWEKWTKEREERLKHSGH
ncbi:hypothetical protein HK096_002111, partial [Nowakowskiella sp. JEL0078]